MRRMINGAEHFMEIRPPAEPDVTYFQPLRRIRLKRDNAYPILRRHGQLPGAGEAELTQEKVHTVRGSILTSYVTFSAQGMAMARALRFFFAGRGRHTGSTRDWSSDVCSSDLVAA